MDLTTFKERIRQLNLKNKHPDDVQVMINRNGGDHIFQVFYRSMELDSFTINKE